MSNVECDEIINRLTSMLPAERPIALHEPTLGQLEENFTKDCLRSGWISTAGAYVDRFEKELAHFCGIEHAIATVNGTSALHTCIVLAGVKANDEVLVPALTFVGTLNPIAYQQAIPHLLDCEKSTLGIDPEKLDQHLQRIAEIKNGTCINRQTGRTIRALVVVHILGIPANMPALARIAEQWNLILIEDAAESLGSFRDQRHTGDWAQLSALSFNGNKIISSGGGGAVLTKNSELAAQARHISTTAKQPHSWDFIHDKVGYNYRLPNLNAALACAQLQRLPEHLSNKRKLYRKYRETFSDIETAKIHQPPEALQCNHWLNLLLLSDKNNRDLLLQEAHAQGLLLRPLWNPMQQLPMYAQCPSDDLSTTQQLWETGICLPSSPGLAA